MKIWTVFLMLITQLALKAQNEVNIQDVKFNATFQHISCHVNITGDENRNSSLLIEYKPAGSFTYLPGAETMRAYPTMNVDGSPLAMNFHAGSAMFLEPGTAYAIRLSLSDPDGGGSVAEYCVGTRSYPTIPSNANVISVNPSDGTSAINSVINSAAVGDIIEFEDGTYSTLFINRDSIYLRAKNLHGAIIDGANTDRGTITVGVFDDSIRNVFVDGFVIRNGRWGLDAQNTQYLTVQNCDFTDVSFGIVNRRANGWEHDQYITNNKFVGRTPWPQSDGNIPSERAVDIRGNNNVISYNTISDFGDGITGDGPPYRNSYSLDVHHNDLNRIVDDLIEVDGMVSNSRVYSNRAVNGRAGVSLAPVYGGPAYVFRNQFANMENSTFKMNRKPAGLYIVHNTTLQSRNGMSSDAGWQNTIMKNNVVMGGRYCFEEFGLVTGSMDDWNYNGYYSSRNGSSGEPWFKWNDIRYADVSSLISNAPIEANAVQMTLADLLSASLPTSPYEEVNMDMIDLSLSENSVGIDTGDILTNLNLPYISDGAPDLGFREQDAPLEYYGFNFTETCRETADTLTWTGQISQSWNDRRNWSPCGVPDGSTIVVIPPGLTRYPAISSRTKISVLNLEE